MSRLRGEKVTDADRRLWKRLESRYHDDDYNIPRRIHKRLWMVYGEWFETRARNGGFVSSMPGRFLAQGGVYEQLSPAVQVVPTTPPKSS